MGGKRNKFKKLTRKRILTFYKAGPETVISFISYIQVLYSALPDQLEKQKEVIVDQERRIQELETIVRKDSHNSNKPPSSDGFKKIPKVRKPTGKKPGGQNRVLGVSPIWRAWPVIIAG